MLGVFGVLFGWAAGDLEVLHKVLAYSVTPLWSWIPLMRPQPRLFGTELACSWQHRPSAHSVGTFAHSRRKVVFHTGHTCRVGWSAASVALAFVEHDLGPTAGEGAT